MGRMNTATLVQIKTAPYDDDGNPITNANGNIPAVGFVDVQPLVNNVDGSGTATPHGTVYKIPYFRIQGGKNAIVCDPQKDDLGICIFADRDVSSVKANKAQANPGSSRRFDIADGLYLGGMLNQAPQCYVYLDNESVTVSPDNGTTSFILTPNQIVGQIGQNPGVNFTMTAEQIQMSPDGGLTSVSLVSGVATVKGTTINVDATGAITLTAGATITFAAPTIAIDCETLTSTATDNSGTGNFTFNGGFTINGVTIDMSGNTISPATLQGAHVIGTTEVTAAGTITLSTHHHTGVTTGAGVTGGPAG